MNPSTSAAPNFPKLSNSWSIKIFPLKNSILDSIESIKLYFEYILLINKFIKNYMSKSKFIVDKLAKLIEEGFISYKDFSSEILNILKSKRDEIIFKMKLASKEETDILNKRIENLEKKIQKLEKNYLKKKLKR